MILVIVCSSGDIVRVLAGMPNYTPSHFLLRSGVLGSRSSGRAQGIQRLPGLLCSHGCQRSGQAPDDTGAGFGVGASVAGAIGRSLCLTLSKGPEVSEGFRLQRLQRQTHELEAASSSNREGTPERP